MASRQALDKLRAYEKKASIHDAEASLTSEELDDYAFRLNRSVQILRNQVEQSEAKREKLKEQHPTHILEGSSSDARTRLHQLRTVEVGYRKLANSEPALPSTESPLPALLAVRHTLKSISQSKDGIVDLNERCRTARRDLAVENENYNKGQSLNSALRQRSTRLHVEIESYAVKEPAEIVINIVTKHQQRRLRCARGMRELVKAFNAFVNDHLARMLAAEDLGGPVVGDAPDMNDDILVVGFTQHGKAKKIPYDLEQVQSRRSQRNGQIWGDDNIVDDEGNSISEADMAASVFRSLTESLLNAAAVKEGSSPYIQIPKENAAVRFLVRAKVAQFHPQDSRRLRLFDLGKVE